MPPLEAGVRELLEGAPLAHVATLMPDGSPHSVPVFVGVEDGRLAPRPRAGKARDLDRDPRVCVSLTHETVPSCMAQVRGRVVEKYTGAPHPVRDDRVLFLVESDRSWSQAFG